MSLFSGSVAQYRLGLCISKADFASYGFAISDLHTFSPVSTEMYAVVNNEGRMDDCQGTAVKRVQNLVCCNSADQQTQHYWQLTHIINMEIHASLRNSFSKVEFIQLPSKKSVLELIRRSFDSLAESPTALKGNRLLMEALLRC